jgi:hypothetical protein
MPRKAPSKEDLRTHLAELSGWHTATRDDARVAEELYETHAMDRVHSLNEAVFFDEFFHYMKEIEVWPLLENLDPQDRTGQLYSFINFTMVTIMRCVGGIPSMLAMHELLLTDTAIMDLLGFNAAQVLQGGCDRGLSRRKKPVEIRGALSYETIADNIVKIGPEKLAEMFNGAIRCLAKQGIFPKKIDASLDATDDEATPNYTTDAGDEVPHVTREKRPDVRANGHARKIEVTAFGWKIWLIFDPVSGTPMAMKIDGINVADNTHAYEVLDQARKNLAGHATIRSVALDRGFLDGKLLWKIDKEANAIVYIPAKSNLAITTDAREIARRAAASVAKGEPVEGAKYKERIEEIKHESGKSAWVEKRKTIVVRIPDLPCDWWTSEGSTSAANSKSFKPRLINATVVLCWNGAPNDEDKEVVILDTDPSTDPFAGLDAYAKRSNIENTVNREAKESWFLEHHPKRSEAGVRVQAYFVFMCMALIKGFRKYRKEADEAEARNEEIGITRYRRQLKVTNYGKLIVFCGNHFGIFKNHEVMLLLGAKVRESALAGETAESVLTHYCAKPDTSGIGSTSSNEVEIRPVFPVEKPEKLLKVNEVPIINTS